MQAVDAMGSIVFDYVWDLCYFLYVIYIKNKVVGIGG